jgi:hypothetical protein
LSDLVRGKLPWSRFLSEDFDFPFPIFIPSQNKCSLGVKKQWKYLGAMRNKTDNVRKTQLEVGSCNHSCSGKAISFICCECVSVALGSQHAVRMHHIVARLYNIFPHYLIKGMV